MNTKNILTVLSAAAALAVASQSNPAVAFECTRSIQHGSTTCANDKVASGKSKSTITGVTATTNIIDYEWNYEFGPTFPTAFGRLVNQDGMTPTNNAKTGNPCNPVVDGLKGDGAFAKKTCEVKASNLPGGAAFLKITIP